MVVDDLESTAVAAFSTDREGRISDWNEGAKRLLGYQRKEVLGRKCHEIIQGTDLAGNRYCSEWCIPRGMAALGECIRPYSMDVGCRSGETVRVFCSILARSSEHSSPSLTHLLHIKPSIPDDYRQGESTAATTNQADGLDAAILAEQPKLTARELEVLRLLSAGAATQVIAASLFISSATVRTHVQAILRKIGAHSKLEAVSIAIRLRLIRMP
jgi:DNA-binding CsgD family transcriptional regulator